MAFLLGDFAVQAGSPARPEKLYGYGVDG